MYTTRSVGARFAKDGDFLSAPQQAQAIGASSFCVFLQAQQHHYSPPSTAELIEFSHQREAHGYSVNAVVAHASYELNLCECNPYFRRKYQNRLLTEANFCQTADIPALNIHLGSRIGKVSKQAALTAAVECINELHQAFPELDLILENTVGFAGQLGSDLADIDSVLNYVDNPEKTGFALNTSHAFSAGYDFRTESLYDIFIQSIESLMGLQRLRHLFFNDSQTAFNQQLDMHANLGKGTMGLELFRYFLRDPRLASVPIFLETPDTSCWQAEICWISTENNEVNDEI